jgi:hypothetical protein
MSMAKLVRMGLAVAGLLVALTGCYYAQQQCCDCMATKDVGIFGDCLTETEDVCVEQLSKDPPNVNVINEMCRTEQDGYCTESCKDILYRN